MKKIVEILIIVLLSVIAVETKEIYAYWDNNSQTNNTVIIGNWAYAWNSKTSYTVHNIVTYKRTVYISTKSSVNKVPSSKSKFWDIY